MPRDDERDDNEPAPDQPTAPPRNEKTRSDEAAAGAPNLTRQPIGANANPDLAAYRRRIEEQLVARREALSGGAPPNLPTKVDPSSEEQPLKRVAEGLRAFRQSLGEMRTWLIAAPFAACLIAGGAVLFIQRGDAGPTGELRQALQQERDRSERLSRDVALAWRQLTVQATALADRAAIEQEARDLRQALGEAEETSAGLEQTISQERDRSRQLEQLLAARQATANDKATQREVATLRQSLKQVQDELGAQSGSLAQERDKVRKLEEQIASRDDTRQRETDELRQSLQQAQLRAEAHQRSLAEERRLNGRLDDELATQQTEIQQLRQALKEVQGRAVNRERSAAAPAIDKPTASDNVVPAAIGAMPESPDLPRLMLRARVLVSQGNISAARGVLERAAETGNAPALFALAETFDPAMLAAWGTVGTQGDPARARELYTRALAGGVPEARERLAASRQ